jgi:hypothetical protein
MNDLDFSELTDDQLLALVRAALRECVSRGDVVQAAAQAAVLNESEKVQIAREAAEAEAAKQRARERERIAREAADQVRREAESQRATERAADEARKSDEARARAQRLAAEAAERDYKRECEDREWLRRAAGLVGREPGEICVLKIKTDYGTRVLINPSTSQYDRKHLADYHCTENTIKTSRELVGRKRALIEFCAEFSGARGGLVTGDDYDFSQEPTCPTN